MMSEQKGLPMMETYNRIELDSTGQYTAILEDDGSLVIQPHQEGHDELRLNPEQVYTLFVWLHDHHRSTLYENTQRKPLDQGTV
jgi:hypothetical protein